MDDPRFRCQCGTFPDAPCGGQMTQEDLLCDWCRAGCNAAIGLPWREYRHVKVTSFPSLSVD